MQQITQLQLLRALAALMVVFGHTQHDALVQSVKLGTGLKGVHALPWGAGVDLFFVISGFIMVYASERLFGRPGAPRDFFARRVARIVPLYWLFLSLYLGLIVLSVWAGTWKMPALVDIVASYFFWPTDAFEDGIPRPLLTLGWTLNYEMFFYALFALFIGLPRCRAVLGVAVVLITLVILGAAFPPSAPAPFFWTRPIVLEFGLGMGLALLLRRGVSLSLPLRGALVAAAAAILIADPLRSGQQAIDWITPNDLSRLLAWGVPAALVVAAAVLGPQGRPSGLQRAGVALGDASYALYLIHPFVIIVFRKLWLAAGMQSPLGLWCMVGMSLILSCLAALATHRLIEKPLTERMHGLIRPRTLPRVASA